MWFELFLNLFYSNCYIKMQCHVLILVCLIYSKWTGIISFTLGFQINFCEKAQSKLHILWYYATYFFHIHLGIGNVSTIVLTNQPWWFYIKRASIFHSFSKCKKFVIIFSFLFEIEIEERHTHSNVYVYGKIYIYVWIYIGIEWKLALERCVRAYKGTYRCSYVERSA